MADDRTLEIVFIDVEARAPNLERDVKGLVDQVKKALAGVDLGEAFSRAFGQAAQAAESARAAFGGFNKDMQDVGAQARQTAADTAQATQGMKEQGQAASQSGDGFDDLRKRMQEMAAESARLQAELAAILKEQEKYREEQRRSSQEQEALTRRVKELASTFATAQNDFRAGKIGLEQYQQAARDTVAGVEALRKEQGLTAQQVQQLSAAGLRAESALNSMANTSVQTAAKVAQLQDRMATLRNDYVRGRLEKDAYRDATKALMGEMDDLAQSTDLNSRQQRALATSAAMGQRALDTLEGRASRLGLAQQVQIALTNQFGSALRNLGPGGGAAAAALTLFQGGLGGLGASLTKTNITLLGFLTTLRRIPGILALATGAALVGGIAALARFANQAATVAQEIETATTRTGLSAEAFQEYAYAAEQAGVKTDLFVTTMQRLQRRAADANAGNKGLKASFDALGVTLTDAQGNMLGTEALLAQVADGLAATENNAERLRLAFKIFDTEGGRLLPMLERGAVALDEWRQQARDLGVVLSGDTIMSLVEYRQEMDTLTKQFRTAGIEITAAFLPVLRDGLIPLLQNRVVPWVQRLSEAAGDLAARFKDFGPAGELFRSELAKTLAGIQAVGALLYGLGELSVGLIQVLTSPFAALGQVLGTLTAPGGRLDVLRRILFEGEWHLLTRPVSESAVPTAELRAAVDAAVEQARAGLANIGQGGMTIFDGFDIAGNSQRWLEQLNSLAESMTRETGNLFRQAGEAGAEAFGEGIGAGGEKVFAAGSLAALEQALQEARTLFREAGDDLGRATAFALIQRIEAAIETVQGRFKQMVRDFSPAELFEEQGLRTWFPEDGLPLSAVRRIERDLAQAWARAVVTGMQEARLGEDALQAQWSGLGPNWEAQRAQQERERQRLAEAARQEVAFQQLRADATARYVVQSQAALRADEDALQAAWKGRVDWDFIRRQERLAAERALEAERRLGAERSKMVVASTAALRAEEDAAQIWWSWNQRSRQAARDLEASRVVRGGRDARMEEDALQEMWTGLPDRWETIRANNRRSMEAQAAAEAQLNELRLQAANIMGLSATPLEALIERLEKLAKGSSASAVAAQEVIDSLREFDAATRATVSQRQELNRLQAAIAGVSTGSFAAARDLAGFRAELEELLNATKDPALRAEIEAALGNAGTRFTDAVQEARMTWINAVQQSASGLIDAFRKLRDGDTGGGIGGILGVGGNLLGMINPIWGAVVGGVGALIAQLFGGQGQRQSDEQRRQMEARTRSTPAVNINFTFNQTNHVEAAVNTPEFQAEMRRQASIAIDEFMSRARFDQRLPALGAG